MWLGNVIIYRNLAYVPVMHSLSGGGWYTGEPVTVVPVTIDDIARALDKVRRAGNPPVTPVQVALAADPILRSTGAQTWGRLALYAASYEISWDEEEVHLAISMLDERGRFVPDPAKDQRWPPGTSVRDLAALMVADWQGRLSAAGQGAQPDVEKPPGPAA